MRDEKTLLEDMLWRIDRLIAIRSQGYEKLAGDVDLVAAVVRYLEIIGEIARTVPSSYRIRHTEIPWNNVVGLRNILAHDYERVDVDILWKTITVSIPQLRDVIVQALANDYKPEE